MKTYDVAIVGYGPAGITAAIYAARRKLSVALVGVLPGGEIMTSGEIENWPGDRQTDGLKLGDKFVQHLQDHQHEVEIAEDKVTKITRLDNGEFELAREGGEGVRGRTVIYTAGRHPRLLNVPGEKEFRNKGITYCATCDAPLFQDKEVAVIGGGDSGAEAVIMLQRIAKKIYLLHIDDKLKAAPVLVENFTNDPKVEILYKAKTSKIMGEAMVSGLEYEDLTSGEKKQLAIEGVFVTIGAIPNTEPVKELVKLDEFGAVVADRYGKTNVPGFFAAGDVTDIRDAQIVVAAGHGCSAALSAGDYLSRREK